MYTPLSHSLASINTNQFWICWIGLHWIMEYDHCDLLQHYFYVIKYHNYLLATAGIH